MITRKYRRLIILLISALFGLFSTLSVPAWSNSKSNQALQLAQQGQQNYNIGNFDQAIQFWQAAAKAYQQMGDKEGMTKSLINQSQALQELGLYPKACKTLLQSFAFANPTCNADQIDKFLTNIAQQQNSLSLIKLLVYVVLVKFSADKGY